jgi:hypothetical protein
MHWTHDHGWRAKCRTLSSQRAADARWPGWEVDDGVGEVCHQFTWRHKFHHHHMVLRKCVYRPRYERWTRAECRGSITSSFSRLNWKLSAFWTRWSELSTQMKIPRKITTTVERWTRGAPEKFAGWLSSYKEKGDGACTRGWCRWVKLWLMHDRCRPTSGRRRPLPKSVFVSIYADYLAIEASLTPLGTRFTPCGQ